MLDGGALDMPPEEGGALEYIAADDGGALLEAFVSADDGGALLEYIAADDGGALDAA